MVGEDQGHRRCYLLHRVLLSVDRDAAHHQQRRGLVCLRHQRDLRTDALAPDPVAVQVGGAAHLRVPADPGRVRADQELLCRAHGGRPRAQGEDRDMTPDIAIGLVMLFVMIGAIFIGVPISFTLLFLALTFGYLSLGDVVFSLAYFQTIGMMKEELLAAVPLFIFMGFITEQAGLMERLFSAFRMVLAPIRGSLYIVVIVTSAVFAMATGIVGAAVTVLGIMAAPIMIKTGYDAKLSAGAITAGGTLGILIPPSVMLIVMGPVLGVSVADLYAAAFGPGFLLAGIYLVYLIVRSFINPKLGPPVPEEERVHDLKLVLWECVVGLVPVTVLTIATLGVILAGITTSTEAAAMGAFGAILLVVSYGRFTVKGLLDACYNTLATTSMVL